MTDLLDVTIMRRLIWPLGIRLLHAVLAITMIASFLTHEMDGAWHEWPGYIALAAALIRLAWGLLPATREAPARYIRFAGFLRNPAQTWHYIRLVLHRQEPRFLGHSPLGGWIVLALLSASICAGISGWMLVTDRFFGVAWVMSLHNITGHAVVPLVLMHWAAIAYGSWRHRENLAAAMLHGKKPIHAKQPRTHLHSVDAAPPPS
jgi:cytochrome b